MGIINAIFQAIIQGLTEFLPVSSSGHLSLYQHFTGNSGEGALFFSAILHLGTLVAVFVAFRKTIWDMIKELGVMIKDIFTGKDGMFLNFHNAGGMDLWGVFFFFIASPYTLLVLFVDKADIIYLVNILTVLKMMTAAVTAQLYFRSCQKKLDPYIGAVLSVIYAFCGYGMFYYQNNIWLDMMYLFPLLMVAFRELFEKKRIIPYTVMLTLMMIVNYYISYMICLLYTSPSPRDCS